MLPYILLPIKNKGGRDFNEMSQIDGSIIPFMLLRFFVLSPAILRRCRCLKNTQVFTEAVSMVI